MRKITQLTFIYHENSFKGLNVEDNEDLIPVIMVEFAKMHVKAALKAALEDAPCGSSTDTVSYEDMEDAILKAYPETNIK